MKSVQQLSCYSSSLWIAVLFISLLVCEDSVVDMGMQEVDSRFSNAQVLGIS